MLWRLRGFLDTSALTLAIGAIVSRHEALRTPIHAPHGEPLQVIDVPQPFTLGVTDLGGTPAARREPEARSLLEKLAGECFDLANGPLLRAHLVRLEDEDQFLIINVHHVAFDGWSGHILARELAGGYAAYGKDASRRSRRCRSSTPTMRHGSGTSLRARTSMPRSLSGSRRWPVCRRSSFRWTDRAQQGRLIGKGASRSCSPTGCIGSSWRLADAKGLRSSWCFSRRTTCFWHAGAAPTTSL